MKLILTNLLAEFFRAADKRTIPKDLDCLRDGERRLLYVLYKHSSKDKLIKSARIVGDTIGQYHPHGDNGTYETLQKLHDYNYIEGQGDWGIQSKTNRPAGAYRYTECKLKKWVKKLCFEYINFSSFKINDLECSEPTFIPSPIPIGIIGDGIITGIGGAHNTFIPKYDIIDLSKRLLWLLNNKDKEKIIFDRNKLSDDNNYNENLYGPCIKPNDFDCHVFENTKGDFYELLFNGSGKITYIPFTKIINCAKEEHKTGKMICVYGIAPNMSFNRLIEDSYENEDKIIKLNCDILNGDYELHELIKICTRKNDKSIEDYHYEIVNKYLKNTITFSNAFYNDDTNQIFNRSIDWILLNNYYNWMRIVFSTRLDEFNKLVSNYFKTKIIIDYISPILKTKQCNNRNDVINEYKILCTSNNILTYKKIELIRFNSEKISFENFEEEVTPDFILKTMSEKKIHHLIEFNDDLNEYIKLINESMIKILDIEKFCYNYIENISKGFNCDE